MRNLPLTFDCMYCGQKLVEDFAKFLWPSQNIWTLKMMMNNVASWNDLPLNRDWKSTYLPTWKSTRLKFLTQLKKINDIYLPICTYALMLPFTGMDYQIHDVKNCPLKSCLNQNKLHEMPNQIDSSILYYSRSLAGLDWWKK